MSVLMYIFGVYAFVALTYIGVQIAGLFLVIFEFLVEIAIGILASPFIALYYVTKLMLGKMK